MVVTTPSGGTLFPNGLGGADNVNNVEQVIVANPGDGTYVVTISGTNVPLGHNLCLGGKPAASNGLVHRQIGITQSSRAGEPLFYTVTVTNNGPADATNVVVTDTLPPEATYISDTDTCVEAPAGTLTCSLGSIANGSSKSFTIMVNVASDAMANGASTLTNQASVSAENADPNPANDSITLVTLLVDLADLKVTKISEPHTTVQAGETFTYTIFVDNLGPSVARNVVITDTLLNEHSVTIQSCAFSVSQGGAPSLSSPVPRASRFHPVRHQRWGVQDQPARPAFVHLPAAASVFPPGRQRSPRRDE